MNLTCPDFYFYLGEDFESLIMCSNKLKSLSIPFNSIKKITNSYFVNIESKQSDFTKIGKKITPAYYVNPYSKKIVYINSWQSCTLRDFFNIFNIEDFTKKELNQIAEILYNENIDGRRFLNLQSQEISKLFACIQNRKSLEELIVRVRDVCKLHINLTGLLPLAPMTPEEPIHKIALDRQALLLKYNYLIPQSNAVLALAPTPAPTPKTIPEPASFFNSATPTSYTSPFDSTLTMTMPEEYVLDLTLDPLNPIEQVTEDFAIPNYNSLVPLTDFDFDHQNESLVDFSIVDSIPLPTEEPESNKRLYGNPDNNPKRRKK